MSIRTLPVNVHVRLWGSFVSRIAASAVFPFMALYLSEEISKTFAGAFLSVTVLLGFFTNIIAGYITDRYKRKKLVVILSYIDAIFLILMTVAVYKHWINLFIICFLVSVTVSTLKRPALRALVQDVATQENRKLIYQLDYWLINLSLALGAALGGLLYQEHRMLLFVFLAASSLFISTVYLLFIKESDITIKAKKHNNIFRNLIHSYSEVSRNKPFVILTLGSVFIMYAELSTSSYVAVRLAESFEAINLFGFNMTGIRMFSTINIINTLTVVTCTFLIAKIVERVNLKKIMLIGLVVYSIGYITLTSANTWWLIILAILIATFGELIYAPIFNAEQLDLIPADQRGAYGAFSSLGFNGADLLSKMGIIIGAYLNPLAMSVVMAVIVGMGSFCMMYGLFGQKSEKREEETHVLS